MKWFFKAFAALSFFLPAMSLANAIDELVEIKANTPLLIKSDRAYLLLQVSSAGMQPNFLRIPTAVELDAYEQAKLQAFVKAEPLLIKERDEQILKQSQAKKDGAAFQEAVPPVPSLENFNFSYFEIRNRQNIDGSRAYVKAKSANTFLVEAVPGNYVLFGAGWKEATSTCLCLGTIGFLAEPGVITNLGEIIIEPAMKTSDRPEFAGETGLGPSVNRGHHLLFAVAVKPAHNATNAPLTLARHKIRSANYYAVGKYVTTASFNINRLPPISGVLSYRNGKVIDEKTGKEALGAQ
jgi:hypothetical protein